MTKRPSLFSPKAVPVPEPEAETMRPLEVPALSQDPMSPAHEAPRAAALGPALATKYPKASTREGKRVVTAYVSPEAFRQLKMIAAGEDAQIQDLLAEGLNAVFEKRGLSRIA